MIPVLLILLILLTECLALLNKFTAAVVYSVWLLVLLILILDTYKKFNQNLKDFCIAFTTILAIRIMQFLAPMDMLQLNYIVLSVYSALFIAAIMHARHMKISILRLHKIKGLQYLLPLVPFAFLASFLAVQTNAITTFPFTYANLAIILFASYTQALFFFGVLQNRLHNYLGYNAFILVALIPSLFFLNNLNLASVLFITNLLFAYIFQKTGNIITIAIPEAIINFLMIIRVQ